MVDRPAVVALSLLAVSCGRIDFAAAPPRDAPGDTPSPDTLDLGPACAGGEPYLACFDFEGDVADLAGGNIMVASEVSFVAGIDGQAVQVTEASRIDATTAVLGATAATVDAWVLPTGQTTADGLIIDHNARWGMGVTVDGRLFCVQRALTVAGGTVTSGMWQHVACTMTAERTTAFVNGVEVGSLPAEPLTMGNGAFSIGGNAPVTDVSVPFLGTIDRLRVWGRALSAQELCVSSGNSDC